MHASSLENMALCIRKYYPDPVSLSRPLEVLDVGGSNVNGNYRDLFAGLLVRYVAADLRPGDGVDLVLDDPYHLELADSSVDVVLSGQMLEHCDFFWRTFAEMVRVLTKDGFLFLIAPSAGPIHSHPVDCYRFHPDTYEALARFADCELIEWWLDERGPWRDLVGVFRKQGATKVTPRVPTGAPLPFTPPPAPGSEVEERMAGGCTTHEILKKLHGLLRPSLYLEIGVRTGASLALTEGRAIGVDPAPELGRPLAEGQRVVAMTSDDFFRTAADAEIDGAIELAFIDGMHLFEYALRDFMNIERRAGPGAVVAIDDVFPNHPAQAERRRRTQVWTGDVWKLIPCLADTRPDLSVLQLDTRPTGLALLRGLDPQNRTLWQRYNTIVRAYTDADRPPPVEVLARSAARAPDDDTLLEFLGR